MKAICLVAALVSSMVISADSAKTDFPVELLGDLNGMSLPRTKSASTGSLIKGASDLVIATKTQAKAKKRCLHAVGELLEIVDKSDFTQLCRDYGYEVFSGEKTSRKIDITGFYNEAGSPTINAAVSRLCNISLGPIGNARSDLDSVLDLNWYNNSFQLAIEVAGIKLVDEDIYIDRGDVVLIKAFLKAAEGTLYFLRGVDVTMDYEEVMSAAVDVYSDFVDAELDLISAFDLSPFSRLSISDKSDIQKARAAFAEAVELAKTGDALVKARNDGLNHLLQYDRGGLSDVIQFILRHEQSLLAALDQFITPLQMDNADVASGVFELTYTGEPLSPAIGSVTVGGTSVPYNLGGTTSATEIGTYEMTLVGYGRSTGTKTVVWKIVEPPPSSVVFNLAGHGTRTGGGELEQLVAWKQAAVAPEVVPETGYRFLGWDKEFDDVVGALTVTAQWEQIRCVVDLDGKILDDCVYGQEMTASTFASVTNGWTNIVCTGWVGTGDVPATGDGAEVTFTVTQPSMLRWLYQTNYWVSVSAGEGGSVAFPADGQWMAAGTTLTAEAVSDRGWSFGRWKDVESGESLDAECVVTRKIDAPLAWQAEFVRNKYLVRYDANGGTGTILDQVFEYGIAQDPDIASLANPGFVLAGWARSEEGEAEFWAGSGVSNLTEVAEADVTLYAVWAPDSDHYAMAFRKGDGNGRMFNVACETNKVYSLPPNNFIPPVGKCFAGWQCSNGKRYDDGMLVFNLAQPGETVTMTAIWE